MRCLVLTLVVGSPGGQPLGAVHEAQPAGVAIGLPVAPRPPGLGREARSGPDCPMARSPALTMKLGPPVTCPSPRLLRVVSLRLTQTSGPTYFVFPRLSPLRMWLAPGSGCSVGLVGDVRRVSVALRARLAPLFCAPNWPAPFERPQRHVLVHASELRPTCSRVRRVRFGLQRAPF